MLFLGWKDFDVKLQTEHTLIMQSKQLKTCFHGKTFFFGLNKKLQEHSVIIWYCLAVKLWNSLIPTATVKK